MPTVFAHETWFTDGPFPSDWSFAGESLRVNNTNGANGGPDYLKNVVAPNYRPGMNDPLQAGFNRRVFNLFRTWEPALSPGGVIAFHDYADDAYPGVTEAVRELGLQGEARGHLYVWRKPR